MLCNFDHHILFEFDQLVVQVHIREIKQSSGETKIDVPIAGSFIMFMLVVDANIESLKYNFN